MSVPAMATEVLLSESAPNPSAATPSLAANTNPSHLPQATGLIVVSHSPLGTPTPNTGRNMSATQSAYQKGHSLVGWNGIRNPGNRS